MAETVDSILKKKGDAIWSVKPTATVYEAIAMMAKNPWALFWLCPTPVP